MYTLKHPQHLRIHQFTKTKTRDITKINWFIIQILSISAISSSNSL